MTVGWELVVLHTTSSMFGKFPVHTSGGVDVWTKNIQCRFIEGQTHFGIPEVAKLSSALDETGIPRLLLF